MWTTFLLPPSPSFWSSISFIPHVRSFWWCLMLMSARDLGRERTRLPTALWPGRFNPFIEETCSERGMDDAGGFHRISYSRDDILLMFYGLFQRWSLVGGGSQLESLLRTSISLFLSRSPFWGWCFCSMAGLDLVLLLFSGFVIWRVHSRVMTPQTPK